MADKDESEIDELRKELVKLADITNDCQRSYSDVLGALKNGEILPLATQPLLQQHLESVNNMSVIKMVENRLNQIQSREKAVLVAGEFNAGKSTFVNILMGGPYLPMDRGRVTHVVCEIRHDTLRMAILIYGDKGDNECIYLKEDSTDVSWKELRECIRTRMYKSKEAEIARPVERILLYWPLKVMEGMLDENKGSQDQCDRCTTTGLAQHDSMVRQEIDPSDQSSKFPPEFVSRLERPHARSFKADEHAETQDPDQTSRKEIFTSQEKSQDPNQTNRKCVVASKEKTRVGNKRTSPGGETDPVLPKSKPIEIDVKGNLNTPFRASVEYASDAASVSLHDEYEDLLQKRKDDMQGHMSDAEDLSESESADDHQTNVKQVFQRKTESHQTKREETSSFNYLEPKNNQMHAFRFVFLDCPGIDLQDDEKDSPEYTGMVGEVERCQAFIFITDTTKDTGVKKRGIKALMQDIEASFRSRNMNMNPDQSFFVANKADAVLEDTESAEKLKKEVAQNLAEIWPLTRKEHVCLFQANKELKERLHSNSGPRFVQRFLLKAIRLTLEEHCIWLLRMLEIAHAMAKLGQKSSPVLNKLTHALDTVRQDAMVLQNKVNEISDYDTQRKAWDGLKAHLLRHDTDFHNIQWDINEIKAKIPNEEIDWQEISESVHLLICEKIEEKNSFAAETLRKTYTREFDEIYKTIDEKMKKLETGIAGLEELKREERSLKGGIFSLIAPAAISLSVRAAPVVYPFVFLAVPVLSVGLFGQLVIEDIRESRKESRRSEFKTHKIEFMQKETDRVLKIAKMGLKGKGSLPESPLYKYFFGESKKKVIHDKTEKVLQVVKILKEMAYYKNESSQKCCKKYLIEMMKFYVEKVMKHEFTEKDDIIWVLNEEGFRRTIEHGGNACTYEAYISDRFDFKKLVAVKEFRCKLEPSDMSKSLPAEVDAYNECFYLRQLSRKHHHKLVNFLGTGTSITDGYLNLRIVMERYVGNLKRHVIASPRSPSNRRHREEYLHYAKECTEGLKFLHDNNVIHRDVKPSNYLIKEDIVSQTGHAAFYSVVISDVGCAKAEEAICTHGQEKGTRVYWAPEISLANTFHSKSSDVFSLGLVLWEVWVRNISYNENGLKRELLKVVEAEDIPVISNCLKTDPRRRITAASLLHELEKLQT